MWHLNIRELAKYVKFYMQTCIFAGILVASSHLPLHKCNACRCPCLYPIHRMGTSMGTCDVYLIHVPLYECARCSYRASRHTLMNSHQHPPYLDDFSDKWSGCVSSETTSVETNICEAPSRQAWLSHSTHTVHCIENS